MPVTDGIAAAIIAPLLEAVGFLEWDIHWSKAGGSAFALNMYKCNFAAFLFLCMAVYDSNAPYLNYSIQYNRVNNDPWGLTSQGEREYRDRMNPVNVDMLDLDQQMQQMQQQLMQQQQANVNGDSMQLFILQEQIDIDAQMQQQQMQIHATTTTIRNGTTKYPAATDGDTATNTYQQQIEQHHHQQQHGCRLQMTGGEQPFDANEYVILERRKKTPYDIMEEDGTMGMGMGGRDNGGTNNQDPAFMEMMEDAPRSLPPYPEDYRTPFSGQRFQLPYIILSSLLGIGIGDCAELEALRLIGARRVLVVDTIKPFAAAIIGHVLLDESLHKCNNQCPSAEFIFLQSEPCTKIRSLIIS